MSEFFEKMPLWLAPVLLVVSFVFLANGASWLVDGAVGIAERLNVPKLFIGIVLVGFATTAPEFAVSFMSALAGKPEMALGNAVGSVIVDDGVALALVGFLAVTPVVVPRRVMLQTAVFLLIIDVTAFCLILTNPTVTGKGEDAFVLTRWGGGILLGLFFVYLVYIIWDRIRRPGEPEVGDGKLAGVEAKSEGKSLAALVGFFLLGLLLVVGASKVVLESSVVLAAAAGVPNTVVALTVVAIGTSIPEIATCVTAARKGEGALAVGDILGADILNIAWVAGASAVANPLVVGTKAIFFMFPAMLVIVFTMLGGLIIMKRMTRGLGVVLLAEYVIYMGLMMYLFPPQL